MTEYINKAKLMRKLKKLSTEAYQFKFESKMDTTINACIDVVDFMPTIDIVHCSECRHAKMNWADGEYYCARHQDVFTKDYYCADGERRSDD